MFITPRARNAPRLAAAASSSSSHCAPLTEGYSPAASALYFYCETLPICIGPWQAYTLLDKDEN